MKRRTFLKLAAFYCIFPAEVFKTIPEVSVTPEYWGGHIICELDYVNDLLNQFYLPAIREAFNRSSVMFEDFPRN